MKKYIIMANGKGVRWDNFTDRPKHLIQINGETLLARIVRQLGQEDPGKEIIISASDTRYDVAGAQRYVPQHHQLEIDRFTYELIEDGTCFLYGDTYYTDEAIRAIVGAKGTELLFIGNRRRIFAVKVFDEGVMKGQLDRVKNLFLRGEIQDCKGWQVYQSFQGLPFGQKTITDHYLEIEDETQDFNYPQDYKDFIDRG